MASQHASGSQATTIGTEHFLGNDPDTTAGVFQFAVETQPLQRGDVLEVRIYEKVTGTGDTARQIAVWVFTNEQADPVWFSPSFILLHGWRFSIKQTAGSSRTIKWSVRKA